MRGHGADFRAGFPGYGARGRAGRIGDGMDVAVRLLVKIVSSRVTERQHLSATRGSLSPSFSLSPSPSRGLSFPLGRRPPSFLCDFLSSVHASDDKSRRIHMYARPWAAVGRKATATATATANSVTDGSFRGAKEDYVAGRGARVSQPRQR